VSTTPPSRPARPTHRAAVTAAALASVVGLSACGASLDAQTYQERNNAESTDTAVGSLALRDVAVEPPPGDKYDVGDDADLTITVTNVSDEDDRLVEATSPDADEVVTVDEDGEETELEVPALGSTQGLIGMELRGLTRELRSGQYITLNLRFAENGSTEVLVPVVLSGESDREVFTGEGEEGGEEPALQAPTGGETHGESESDSTTEDSPDDATLGE
jgi:copper(I)-binding protein